jgi:hypothetical protein
MKTATLTLVKTIIADRIQVAKNPWTSTPDSVRIVEVGVFLDKGTPIKNINDLGDYWAFRAFDEGEKKWLPYRSYSEPKTSEVTTLSAEGWEPDTLSLHISGESK